MSRSMTLNDLELPKYGVLMTLFLRFWAATNISRVNCAEMSGDSLRQHAYEIFANKCKF